MSTAENLTSALPDGEYAIVELFGHTTLVGRVDEVERFGAKMLQIEPVLAGKLLGPVLHGGSAIYRFTPCSRDVAAQRGASTPIYLPATIRATVPPEMLPPPAPTPEVEEGEYD